MRTARHCYKVQGKKVEIKSTQIPRRQSQTRRSWLTSTKFPLPVYFPLSLTPELIYQSQTPLPPDCRELISYYSNIPQPHHTLGASHNRGFIPYHLLLKWCKQCVSRVRGNPFWEPLHFVYVILRNAESCLAIKRNGISRFE